MTLGEPFRRSRVPERRVRFESRIALILVSCVWRFFTMPDPLHDCGSGCRPDEGTGVTVVLPNVFGDGLVEFGDAVKCSAPDALTGDFRKHLATKED